MTETYRNSTLLHMTYLERLLEVAGVQRGYVTTVDAAEVGVPSVELRKLCQRGRLEHIAHGLYRIRAFPRQETDHLMEAALWPAGRGVISHEAALALWGLADLNPKTIDVTVPAGYRPRRAGSHKYRLTSRDIDEIDNVDGIPTVTPERAILDAIDTGVQRRFVDQAISTARQLGLFGHETEKRIRLYQQARVPPK